MKDFRVQRHLVYTGDRHHLGSALSSRCIEGAPCNLYRRADQIVEIQSLHFVSNVRHNVGQQKMPIKPRMVLTQNAMQCQLYPGCGAACPAVGGVGFCGIGAEVEFCCATWTAKLSALPCTTAPSTCPCPLITTKATLTRSPQVNREMADCNLTNKEYTCVASSPSFRSFSTGGRASQ